MLTRREFVATGAALVACPFSFADDAPVTNVFAAGEKPQDYRHGKPKNLDGYFPFAVPKTKAEWDARRQRVREQIHVATGIWPMPEKTPLNAVVHGKVEKDGYSIEKVYFASTPGHYVCGNLYRPIGASSKQPGVLFAHGHWAGGRFHDDGEKVAEASVKSKAEADLDRGRFFMQAIPVTLARMGIVCFQYDMIGYADSTALPHVARSGVPNPNGFADAMGDLRLQSLMGLQTWNSVRSLDFLESLPDVDAAKLAITGASGGGTQSFILAAVDDRLAACFPAVMVSTSMQGGCPCENCSLLRVNTGNVEIAATFAPKPLAMSAANDWTKELMTKGFPELKRLYGLYGAEDKVAAKAWLEYGHNYNQHAREFMYAWFSKHLLGKDEKVEEKPYKPTPVKELSVFDAEHPRPADELKDAIALREKMNAASDAQMAKLAPKDAKSLAEFKRVTGAALRAMVNSELPNDIATRKGPLASRVDDVAMHRAVLGRVDEADAVVTVGLIPKGFSWEKFVVWVHPKGKASLVDGQKIVPAARALLDAGYAVVAMDCFGVGEMAATLPVDKKFAGFTYGYNRGVLANRVHDILTVIAFTRVMKAKTTHLVGWGEAGPWAVLARALAGDAVDRLAADLNQFRFESIKEEDDPMMLPGAVKYGGLPAFLAAAAPGEVLAHNHRGTATGQLPKAAYAAAGAEGKLVRDPMKWEDKKVAEWVVRP
jgi:hypothetical protein